MIAWTLIIGICTLLLLVYYLLPDRRQARLLNKIPGPKSMPLLGHAYHFMGPSEEHAYVSYDLCKPFWDVGMIRIWMFNLPYVFIFSPEKAEAILASSVHIDKSLDYQYLHEWLGTGLLTSTGAKWHSRRKMLTQCFHFKILECFLDVFNKQSSKMLEVASKKSKQGMVNILPLMTNCTLDIIYETALGVSINAQDNPDSEYVQTIFDFTNLIHDRQVRPYLKIDFIYSMSGYKKISDSHLRILHEKSYEVIKAKRMALKNKTNNVGPSRSEEGIKAKYALLDLLLSVTENGKALSDEDIREEVDTFMFEGHDTTASSLTFCIFALASHPEIQQVVFEEQQSIFDGKERDVTMDDVREMKYLECCIKESLRLHPSVPVMGRHLNEDCEIDGYVVPANTSVVIGPYLLHRNPNYYPDPEKFIPERFENIKENQRHPYAFLPFSAGPRNCIGQKFAMIEMKTVLSKLIRRFKIESDLKFEELRVFSTIILKPTKDVYTRFIPRT